MDKKGDSKSLVPTSPSLPAVQGPQRAVALARSVAPLAFLAGAGGGVALFVAHLPLLALLVLLAGLAVGAVASLVAKTGADGGGAAAATSDAESDPLQEVRRRISRLQFKADADRECERALEQLRQLSARFASFEKILARKLSPTELTYGRFHGAGEQVVLSVADSLRGCADELEALAGMGLDGAVNRREALSKAPSLTDAEKQELAMLSERLGIRDAHLRKITGLLDANDRALTELDRTIAAIGEMGTDARLAPGGLETAIQELEEIARRARKFQS